MKILMKTSSIDNRSAVSTGPGDALVEFWKREYEIYDRLPEEVRFEFRRQEIAFELNVWEDYFYKYSPVDILETFKTADEFVEAYIFYRKDQEIRYGFGL